MSGLTHVRLVRPRRQVEFFIHPMRAQALAVCWLSVTRIRNQQRLMLQLSRTLLLIMIFIMSIF